MQGYPQYLSLLTLVKTLLIHLFLFCVSIEYLLLCRDNSVVCYCL